MADKDSLPETPDAPDDAPDTAKKSEKTEAGGPKGLEPTRYGDWEKKGRCIDF